ncbi:hypothetical protein LTR62_003403 [Meristemomyces frigidus]|uniref:Homologous-pairing protein 2 winged helix domain-containing protein n=1 Tax=Meristemomyces frigidus TaxID=1508187 RepID=A0AAN7YH33_9PEZI|nr:hypothetical protein LTR62_003403 [Meristemomyces frigidus]
MAPTKEESKKEAKLTPEQAAEMVLDYLRRQNRPYSATDISTNLKNRVTKAAAAKLLKDLHERKEIEGRAAGKQLVYHAIQEEPDEDGLSKLQEMDAETTRLREAIVALKTEEKELRASLREGAVQVPVSELKLAVAKLEEEKSNSTARLMKLQSGNVKPVSAAEREKINAEHKKWTKIVSARSKIRNELWQEIAAMTERKDHEEIRESLDLTV